MNIETFREYCLAKKGVTEGFPFDNVTLVFKVMGKMFALTGLDDEILKVNLKCDPERAIELREQFPENVLSGFHMNKKHWNTVTFDGGISEGLFCGMIDHSYDLVVKKLRKADREILENM